MHSCGVDKIQFLIVISETLIFVFAVCIITNSQTKLVNVAESISAKLTYFTELERIGSRLNSPALSVTSDGFLPLLTRLDECISFTEQNVS